MRRETRARSGLSRPVHAPIPRNDDQLSSKIDGGRQSSEQVAAKKCRIQWSRSLEEDLVRCNELIHLAREGGRQKELFQLWLELHPELPAMVTALTQRLSRIR